MSHPTLENIAAWVEDLEDAGESEALDLHLLECDSCSAQAERLQRLVAHLREALPPVLTDARHRALVTTRPGLPAIHVEPGQTGVLRLTGAEPLGVWVMHCDLSGVTRVDIEARSADGRLVFALADVPFDAERGQVLLACQLHYRSMPPLLRATVREAAAGDAPPRQLGEYLLDHQFENP
jgi:hypothetical protein